MNKLHLFLLILIITAIDAIILIGLFYPNNIVLESIKVYNDEIWIWAIGLMVWGIMFSLSYLFITLLKESRECWKIYK
jgi:hypothetical protein